jgi:hypothetical protein
MHIFEIIRERGDRKERKDKERKEREKETYSVCIIQGAKHFLKVDFRITILIQP